MSAPEVVSDAVSNLLDPNLVRPVAVSALDEVDLGVLFLVRRSLHETEDEAVRLLDPFRREHLLALE